MVRTPPWGRFVSRDRHTPVRGLAAIEGLCGPSVAWAFDDLYYLERACLHQVLAVQAAAGQPLRCLPDALCERVGRQIAGERQQSDLFFASVRRMLDRDEPGWSALG